MYRPSLLVVFAAFLVTKAQEQCSSQPPIFPIECCPRMGIITPEIAQECLPSGPTVGPKGRLSCEGATCMLKKLDLIKDGKANRADFAKAFAARLGVEWLGAIDAAVSTCNREVDAATVQCEPMLYLSCFGFNTLKNCPVSIWVQSTECMALKTFMENCPPPPGPPPMR